ncbi:MAG: OadG family protein [Oscillospiraceae bacterium]
MAVVFFGLILLMLVTKASGKIMQNKEAAAKLPLLLHAPAAPAAPAVKAFAHGSAGEVKLHDVPDRTAAMLAAPSSPTSSESPSTSCASSPSARSRIDST